MELLQRSGGDLKLFYLYDIYPLRVIKQIVTMFFSVNHATFQKVQPELVNFVLDRDRRHLPSKFRLYTYYNGVGRMRHIGVVYAFNFGEPHGRLFSEITFRPFGYVLTIDTEPPARGLCDITHFSRYPYNVQESLPIKAPVLPTYLNLPGDYRSKKEIYEALHQNLAFQQRGVISQEIDTSYQSF